MGRADIGQHAVGRLGDLAEPRHLPPLADAHLDDRRLVASRQAQQGLRYANMVVEVAVSLQRRKAFREDGPDHLLGRRLAVAPADCHHWDGEAVTVRARQFLKCVEGIRHLDQERLPRRLEPSSDDRSNGTLLQRVGHELVTIKADSVQRHEQIAAPDRSRIRPEPSDRHIRQALGQNPSGDRGYFVSREQGHSVLRLLIRTLRGLQQQTHRARASMASRATTRSSKGCFSFPIIW
jgi:hypothetical protein